jgi:sugar phosphate isomerase/epimerase
MLISILPAILLAACSNKPEHKEIGLQLYSLRDDINARGIEAVMEDVARMGYGRVELASYQDGLIYGMEPMQFKELADQHGLKVTSCHVVRNRTEDREADMAFWSAAIEAHASIGVKYIVMPAYPFNPAEQVTMDELNKTCDYFDEVGKMAADAGLQFGLHNHDREFTSTINGIPVYDLMIENLDKRLVFMQMDVYWVREGGYDPVEYLRKYPGHFPVLHIKDEQAIGASGTMDFEAIFEAAYKQGMVDYYVEVEQYTGTPVEDVKQSYDYLFNAPYVK